MAYIPTGDDGYVPEQAIQKRYRDYYRRKQAEYDAARFRAISEGRRPAPAADLSKRDYMRTSDRVIPLKCTPEQIADWWADPSSCDVQDIDCAGLPKVNVPKGMTLLQKRDQGRIRVIASPLEEQRIRRELVMGFEPGDVSKIAATSPVIQVRPMHRPVTGSYSPSDNRVTIDREQGLEQGTVVHELSHQLRATDRSRRGPIVTANPNRDIEESCTVAEQMARSDKVDYSGYYAKACVYDRRSCRWRDPTPAEARRMAEEDHMLFTEGRGKGLKGNAALRSVERHWGESHIARLRIHGSKMAVNRMADETGAVERVSMAKARTKQEAERKAGTPITNLTAGRPGAIYANKSKIDPSLRKRNDNGRVVMPDGCLILVDESGDTGTKEGSSRGFVLTAGIYTDRDALNRIVAETPKNTSGKKGPDELKYAFSSDEWRLKTLDRVMSQNPSEYAAVVLKNPSRRISGNRMYRTLLRTCLDDALDDPIVRSSAGGVEIVVDHTRLCSDPEEVRRIAGDRAIQKGVELSREPRVEGSKEYPPLQAHDFPAGAIANRYNRKNGTADIFEPILSSHNVKRRQIRRR